MSLAKAISQIHCMTATHREIDSAGCSISLQQRPTNDMRHAHLFVQRISCRTPGTAPSSRFNAAQEPSHDPYSSLPARNHAHSAVQSWCQTNRDLLLADVLLP